MSTPPHPATIDRTLQTDEATLRAVAAAATRGTVVAVATGAVAAGLVRDDGTLTDLGWVVGHTVAEPMLTIRVRRLDVGEASQLTVRAGPAAVLVSAPPGQDDGPSDVRVAPADGLVRTLLDLLELGPTAPAGRAPVHLGADEDALAPFLTDADTDGGWTADVGADAARLLRLELHVGDRVAPIVLADLGAGGLWALEGEGDGGILRWAPTSGDDLARDLSLLQQPLLEIGDDLGVLPAGEAVELPDAGVVVDVPRGWERVDVRAPMVLVARTPTGHRAPANMTVAIDRCPEPAGDDATLIGGEIAAALPAGRLVSAVQSGPGDRWATYLHAGPRGDLLTRQRQVDADGRTVLVSMTGEARTAGAWLDEAGRRLARLASSAKAVDVADDPEPSTPDSLDSSREPA